MRKMIYRNKYGLLTDEVGDEGDSARAAGIVSLFGKYNALTPYINKQGYPIRSPDQYPWNNPKNFSRDQLICLSAGMSFFLSEILGLIFWKLFKRCFFCFNSERDIPGSTKYPWPHKFINDKGIYETKLFDFADPLLPHHIFHIIVCARLYCLYPFVLIGWPCLILAILFNSKKIDSEQNQLQCMIKIAGPKFIWFYKLCNDNWANQTRHYWDKRNESEFADMIIEGLSDESKFSKST